MENAGVNYPRQDGAHETADPEKRLNGLVWSAATCRRFWQLSRAVKTNGCFTLQHCNKLLESGDRSPHSIPARCRLFPVPHDLPVHDKRLFHLLEFNELL